MAGRGLERLWLERDHVRELVSCPKCGAEKGWNCVGVRNNVRSSNHLERVWAAEEAGAWAKIRGVSPTQP